MLFVLSKKALFVIKIFNFIQTFSSLSTVSRFQGLDETGIIMTISISLLKLVNVYFGITQKPSCIKPSNLP